MTQEKQQLSPGKEPNWDSRSCFPPLAHVPLGSITASAKVPPPVPTVLGRGSDTGPPAVRFPGAARGWRLSRGWLSCSVPEPSRNRSRWERLECGNGRSALDSSPHRFSKLPAARCFQLLERGAAGTAQPVLQQGQSDTLPQPGSLPRQQRLGRVPWCSSLCQGCRLRDRPSSPPRLQAALQPHSQLPTTLTGSVLLPWREAGAGAEELSALFNVTKHNTALLCTQGN